MTTSITKATSDKPINSSSILTQKQINQRETIIPKVSPTKDIKSRTSSLDSFESDEWTYILPDASGMEIRTPVKYRIKKGEERPNIDYLEFKEIHRIQYNPVANWYKWQDKRTGRNKLLKQNYIAYHTHTRSTPGLHEQHIAEELHRHKVFPTQYTDEKGKSVSIDPSISPMGVKYFHNWPAEQFDMLWLYWSSCFPAHAWEIDREIYVSGKEKRQPWWEYKNTVTQPMSGIKAKSLVPKYITKPDKGFEYIFLSLPCRICGSPDHPALQGREDDYGDVTYKYVCPIAAHDNWEIESMRPCPEKLARWCRYSSGLIEIAIHRMTEHGWGQHISERTMNVFRACAIQQCETDSEGSDQDLFDTDLLYSIK